MTGDVADEGQDHAESGKCLGVRPVTAAEEVAQRQQVATVQRSHQQQGEQHETQEAAEGILDDAEQPVAQEFSAGTKQGFRTKPQREQGE